MEDLNILYYTVHVLIAAFALDIGVFVEESSLPPN
jgi:hypothetical protein